MSDYITLDNVEVEDITVRVSVSEILENATTEQLLEALDTDTILGALSEEQRAEIMTGLSTEELLEVLDVGTNAKAVVEALDDANELELAVRRFFNAQGTDDEGRDEAIREYMQQFYPNVLRVVPPPSLVVTFEPLAGEAMAERVCVNGTPRGLRLGRVVAFGTRRYTCETEEQTVELAVTLARAAEQVSDDHAASVLLSAQPL